MTREEIIEQYPIALAEKEGKKIQYYSESKKKWIDCIASAIYGKEKLRIKPEEKPEQKRIIELSDDGETWLEATRFIPKCEKLYARVRVEKKPTKRPPTIEEVEKWFLENRVFKCITSEGGFYRIEVLWREDKGIRIGGANIFIKQFCEDFTHYDGTELYITE